MTVRDASSEVVSDAGIRADRRAAVVNRSATRLLLGMLLGLVAVSLTRLISDKDGLTTGGALGAAINSAIPIMLAGLGGLWSERAGIVNIGLEGQMVFGTYFAADFAYRGHSAWYLVIGGLIGGLIGGILHAIATVGFGVDQIISGVAINLLAPGVTKYLAGVYFTNAPGGGSTQSPKIDQFTTLKWDSAHEQLAKLDGHHWFLVSDVAGLLDGVVTSLNLFSILALLLIPLTWFVLWRTAFGLRLRSCGENPTAAETLGVKVYTTKTVAVLVSGMLAGLGGAFLVQYTGQYSESQTGGRGYIGLAAMIFGNWRPGGLLAGSSLFGYTDGLQAQTDGETVRALFLFAAIILALAALFALYQRNRLASVVAAVAAAVALVLYLVIHSVPQEFATYSPQIITLVVLAAASQRLRMPAADGLPWRRGS